MSPTALATTDQMPQTAAQFNYERFAESLVGALVARQQHEAHGTPPLEAARYGAWQASRMKAVTPPPTAVMGHGPGGLFSAPGRDRAVFSAMHLPFAGVQSRLPVNRTQDTNPVFSILTGVTATTGSERNGPCDPPPVAGLSKLCETSLPFGSIARRTRVYDIRAFGRRTNRGEMMDYQLQNRPLATGTVLPSPLPGAANIDGILNDEIEKALFELGVAFSRDFARMIWNGNPSTDNTAGGGHKAFWGFNRLINDGYRDYETQVLCPAADSYIVDFQNQSVANNSQLFYRLVTFIYRRLKYIASRTGLNPVRWAIAMPYSLFYEATEVWTWAARQPNVVATALIGSGSTNFIDSGDMYDERNAMRGDLSTYDGQFLLIDGERVEVIIDDSIVETSSGGTFRSSVYFIPMTVLGNRPVTYLDYCDWRVPSGTLDAARVFAGAEYAWVTDDGRFLWLREPPTRGCVELQGETEPRLALRTPFIAARLDNVNYAPLAHEPSWDPTSAYHGNGGRTVAASTPRLYPPSDV